MTDTPTEVPGVACEVEGKSYTFTFKTYGIQLNQSDRKKTQGYVIKWFYVLGSTRDSENNPNVLILHHARKKAFGGSGFQERGPVPEETNDATRLTVLKYPKLALEQLTITFPDPKSAKRAHNGIWKRLKLLGQVPGAKWRVFLNPFSGLKKSKKTWQSFEPWLRAAGVDPEVNETQHAGHCGEMVETMDLEGVDMLVSVSGDGMLHELVNGLMRRKDWHKATQIPVGVIPCGTGNALATSLMFPNTLSALLAGIKRQWLPLDIMAMYQYTYPVEPISSPIPSSPALGTPPSKSPSSSKSKSSPQTNLKTKSVSVSPLPPQSPQSPPPFDVSPFSPRSKSQNDSSQAHSPFSPRVDASDATPTKRKGKKSKSSESAESGPTGSPSTASTSSSPITPHSIKMESRSKSARSMSSSPSMRKPISEAARKAAAKRANQEPGTWNLVCYAFEAFMWGFVSDVDIETEPWRWMGEFRLTLGSLRRIAALRHYPARLLTLEQEGADAHMTTCQFHDKCAVCKVGQDLHHERHARLERLLETSKDGTVTETIKIIEEPSAEEIVEQKTRRNSIIIPEEELVQEDIRASIELASAPEKKKKSKKKSKEPEVTKDVEAEEEVAKEDTVSPTARATEEKDDVSSPSTSSKSKKHNKPVSSEDLESITPSKKPVVEESSSPDPDSTTNTPISYRKNKKKSNKRSNVISVEEAAPEVQEDPAVMRGLAKGLDTLIPFDPMVPGFNMTEGWQEREDKFVYFVASNISHLAGDLKAAPFAHTSGGAVDLIFATSIAKMEFLDLLAGSMENGRYVSNSNVTYEKTKAFVLIPTGKPGIMDMDGEEYDSLPTAIEVHPGVIRACVAVWNLSLHPDDV